jgi:hypothetical protein
MAKAARPHETLAGVDIEALDALDSGSGGLAGTLLQTQALPGNTLPPRVAPPAVPESYVAPVTRSQTTLPAVHRNAWIALGVSFTLLLIVGGAWATRLTQQRQDISRLAARDPAEVQPTAPVLNAPSLPPTPPTPAQNSAPGAGGSSNLELIPLAGANDPPPQQPPHTESPEHQAQSPTRAPRSSSPGPKPDATLDVGVVPWGKIWIDNRLYGWTPLRGIKLHPGRHLIGAGVDSTQLVRKHIHLKPGEQAVLTLQLDASGGADEATGSHSDR